MGSPAGARRDRAVTAYYRVARVDPREDLYSGTGLERCVGHIGRLVTIGKSPRGAQTVPDILLDGADPDDRGIWWWFYRDDVEEASEEAWTAQQILDEIMS